MSKENNTYTAYIVRKYNGTYLNQRTFTGRTPNMWGRIGESYVFSSEGTAEAAANSINARPKKRINADDPHATVVPVVFSRRRSA